MIHAFGPADVWVIVAAIRWTVALSAVAFAGGLAGGFWVALARTASRRPLRLLATVYIRFFQGTPLLMQIFLTYFGLQLLGVGISAWTAASLALTLHASAFLGDIWRGCIEAVPGGQSEAARALGLSYFRRMWLVVLPQAMRVAIGPTVGFLVQLIKGTSLASIIGFVELMRAAQIVNNGTFSPFKAYGLVSLAYFCLCWPLAVFARFAERRLAGPAQQRPRGKSS